MAIHIIIDGYNLIKNSPSLRALDRQDLELGREALIDRLADYKRVKPHKITVVFDGAGAIDATPPRDRIRGIQVVFSRRGRTADAVIKKMAAKEREKALVVSSDRAVAHSAASFQSATLPCSEFEAILALAARTDSAEGPGEDEESGGWIPTTRKKGPSRRLSKRRRRNRMKVRKL